jgi:hypothetical protein
MGCFDASIGASVFGCEDVDSVTSFFSLAVGRFILPISKDDGSELITGVRRTGYHFNQPMPDRFIVVRPIRLPKLNHALQLMRHKSGYIVATLLHDGVTDVMGVTRC